ncbi:unnamed protein product [Soboliphyme baturini]|uniref:Uncharacterized protein n=1 Tax=Soboliphyme baturini TaxID=241478 RepID=A0A183IDV6_9BILA|nr:unnamed protein product [Soboliphyme baturini]
MMWVVRGREYGVQSAWKTSASEPSPSGQSLNCLCNAWCSPEVCEGERLAMDDTRDEVECLSHGGNLVGTSGELTTMSLVVLPISYVCLGA